MKNVLSIGLLFYLFGLFGLATLRPALAAADDAAFNSCLKELNQQSDVLRTNSWHESPPPLGILRFENALSDVGHIQRWTYQENENGTETFVVLNRGNGPQPEDDPDTFDVFLENKGAIAYIETFSASAEAFLSTRTSGVNGIVLCTQGDIGGRLSWNGHEWD